MLKKNLFIIILISVFLLPLFGNINAKKEFVFENNKVISLEKWIESFLQKSFITGYNQLNFFITEEEALKKAVELEWINEESQVTSEIREIFYYKQQIKQDFTFLKRHSKEYINFSFLPKNLDMGKVINDINAKKVNSSLPYHLTQNYKSSFKVIKIPNSLAKNPSFWDKKLIFSKKDLKKETPYRLFAIVFEFNQNIKIDNDLNLMYNLDLQRVLHSLYKKYGKAFYQKSFKLNQLEKHYLSYEWHYQHPSYTPYFPVKNTYNLYTQINVSYSSFIGEAVNFQLTYINSDYLVKLLPKFKNQAFYQEATLIKGF